MGCSIKDLSVWAVILDIPHINGNMEDGAGNIQILLLVSEATFIILCWRSLTHIPACCLAMILQHQKSLGILFRVITTALLRVELFTHGLSEEDISSLKNLPGCWNWVTGLPT